MAADAHSAAGDDWDHVVEESELLSADGSDFGREQFLSGAATPVFHLGGVELRRQSAPRCARRTRTAAQRSTRCRRGPARHRITVQRLRFQGAGRYGLRPPRSHRLRAGVLGHIRTRGRPHPRRHRQTVRHQVRAVGVRSATRHPGHRVAGDVIGLANAALIQAKHCAAESDQDSHALNMICTCSRTSVAAARSFTIRGSSKFVDDLGVASRVRPHLLGSRDLPIPIRIDANIAISGDRIATRRHSTDPGELGLLDAIDRLGPARTRRRWRAARRLATSTRIGQLARGTTSAPR